MKHFYIYIFCAIFLLVGCNSMTEHSFTITNESDYTVSFSLVNYTDKSYTLAPAASITVQAYTFPKVKFTTDYPVKFNSSDTDGKIVNLQSYTLNVNNNYSQAVILSITNDPYFTSVSIDKGTTTTVTMYTSSPIFSIKYGEYSISYSYNADNGYFLNIN
jgi:hypothetical protein